ncbi:hypothetical protein D1871_19400 [Nakamurella silvestris]|nr:hypothetical protein D1871_19400 [Nakamurella silvestris]
MTAPDRPVDRRLPGPVARRWLFAAAVTAVLSLGLPWGASAGSGGSVLPGYFTPGFCSTVYDYEGWASVECSSSYYFPTLYFTGHGGGGIPGAAHPSRALIAVAVVLVILGYRQANRRLLIAAAFVAATAFFAFGIRPASGQLTFGLALVCLVLALRADRMLSAPAAGVLPRRT